MFPRNGFWCSLWLGVGVLFVSATPSVYAQEVCYQYIPQTVYETRPVTVSKWVNETVYETQKVTSYKPVWQTETRERRTTVLKPVYKTKYREERHTVRRPVIEKTYEERRIEETSYETVTEYREQQVVVEKPVIETEYREERVLVRKPVTQTVLRTEQTTVLKPVQTVETEYVPSVAMSQQLAVAPSRRQLQWMNRGYTLDPTTGSWIYQRPGLHWVRKPEIQVQSTLVPTLAEQTVSRTRYVPETVVRQVPIQTTTYQDRIEVRKVPIQVQKMVRQTEVRKVPVTVQKPVTKIRVEKVPVERIVRYQDEEVVRRVPVKELTYERVEKVEPYEVQTCKWVAETREIQVPRTVRRRVDYQITQTVPRTVLKRVAVDAWGNVIPETTTASPPIDSPQLQSTQSTVTGNAALSTTRTADSPIVYYGRPIYLDDLGSDQPESVVIPETVRKTPQPETSTVPVAPKPDTIDSRSGDDSVQRTPIRSKPETPSTADDKDESSDSSKPSPAADTPPSLNGPGPATPEKGNEDDAIDT